MNAIKATAFERYHFVFLTLTMSLLIISPLLVSVCAETTENKAIFKYTGSKDIECVAISPNGKYFASMTDDHTILFERKGKNAEILWSKNEGGGFSKRLEFSDDNSLLIAACENSGNTYLVDTLDGKIVKSYEESGSDVSLSGDGNNFILTENSEEIHNLHFFQKNSSTPIWTFKHDRLIIDSEISNNGNYVVLCDNNKKLYVFEIGSNKPILNASGVESFNSVRISKDGNWIIAGNKDSNIYMFKKDNSTPQWKKSIGQEVKQVALSDDNSVIVCIGSGNDTIYLYSFNGTLLTTLGSWALKVGSSSLAISSGADYIITESGSYNATLACFSKEDNTPRWKNTQAEGISFVDISSDGNYIVASGDQNEVLLFFNSDVKRNGNGNGEDNTIINILL